MYDFSYFPKVETSRLYLRQMTEDDAPAILAEFGDPEVTKYLSDDSPVKDIEGARQFIRWCDALYNDRAGWRWAIVIKESNQMIGTCGFHRWRVKDRRAEIGYDLQKAYWGQGYATEFVNAMLKFGFEQMNLHRIEADCEVGNAGSAAVLEKCGFTHEGTWRDREWDSGRFISLKQFGILEDEYRGTEG